MKKWFKKDQEISVNQLPINPHEKKSIRHKLRLNFLPLIFILYIVMVLVFAIFSMGLNININIGASQNIQDILAKASSVHSVYYEGTGIISVTTSDNQQDIPLSLKYWMKPPNYKMEYTAGSVTIKMIVHPDAVYVYNESQQKYIQMPSYQSPLKSFDESIKEFQQNTDLKVLGTETINGKKTTIASITVTNAGITMIEKFWFWNDYGIPVKMEMTSEMGTMRTTITMEFSNILLVDIPDSEFQIPT